MEKWRVHVDERYARKAAHQRDELIEVTCSTPGDQCTHDHKTESEGILLPLDVRVVLATSGEKLIFHDSDGWEEL